MAFAEHPDSNLHYHLMLRLADPTRHVEFAAIASAFWQEVVAGGSMEVGFLATALDLEKSAIYATKDLWRSDLINNFIISSEFMNKS